MRATLCCCARYAIAPRRASPACGSEIERACPEWRHYGADWQRSRLCRGLAARRRHSLGQLPRSGMAESTAAPRRPHLRVGLRRLDPVPRRSCQAADLGRARRRVACPRPGGDPAASAARTGEPAPRAGRLPAAAGDHPARAGGGCRRRALPLRPARARRPFLRALRPANRGSARRQPRPRPGRWPGTSRLPRGGAAEARAAVAPCCSTTPITLVTRRPWRRCARARCVAGRRPSSWAPGRLRRSSAGAPRSGSGPAEPLSPAPAACPGARCTAPMAISTGRA